MALAECTCRYPRPRVNPGKHDFCVSCTFYINPAWSINDKTLRKFMDGLAAAMPVRGDDWQRFRIDVEAREFAGRKRFEQSFQGRNNIAEGLEEAADGALYCLLDTLVARRAGDEEHMDLALVAAMKFYEAYVALIRLHHKRNGSP